jgi:hypothetical protein
MPKKKPTRKRPLPLSLFPLSPEEAVRRALSVPFVPPKKRKKPKQ